MNEELEIAGRLSRMIQCETVSYHDEDKIDFALFDAFKALLGDLYPETHRACERSFHGKTGILYKWAGRSDQEVTVLMSHYDVVPCNEALWTRPPYSGEIVDGYVWGRGTLDTKGTLCGILEAAETLIRQGYTPENDVYFSFSGDEEITGPSAPALVAHLKSVGVKPVLVLDEGGAIISHVFPGTKKPFAVIGTAEKGYVDLRLVMEGQGGHSSMPPAHSLVGRLAKAVVKLENKPFRPHLTPPVNEMFKTLGQNSKFPYNFLYANFGFFMPVLQGLLAKQGGTINAMIRTSLAVTKMEGSKAYNVLPPSAEIGLNLRLLSTDTVSGVKKFVEDVIDNPSIKVEVVESREASPISPTGSKGWNKVKETIHEVWQGVVVSPHLLLGGSDATHFCKISDYVYRFSAMPLSKEELESIHGHDERIEISNLLSVVEFYKRLMTKL